MNVTLPLVGNYSYPSLSPYIRPLRIIVKEGIMLLTLAVYLFAVVANCIVALVFFKGGFKSTPNINFFALAISDILISSVWAVNHMPSYTFGRYYYEVFGIMDTYFRTCVEGINTIGSWITTIIIWERLCCIVFPLKVKMIFSRKSVFGLILGAVLYEVIAVLLFFVGLNMKMEGWAMYIRYVRSVNSSVTYTEPEVPGHYKRVYGYSLQTQSRMARSFVPNYVLYSAIVIGTVLLIIMFRRSVQVKNSLKGNQGAQKMSTKEARLIKSAMAVCVVYIVTCAPLNVFDTISVFDRDFTLAYLWEEFSKLSRSFNHASNIFVYLIVNPRFRKHFKSLFCDLGDKKESQLGLKQ